MCFHTEVCTHLVYLEELKGFLENVNISFPPAWPPQLPPGPGSYISLCLVLLTLQKESFLLAALPSSPESCCWTQPKSGDWVCWSGWQGRASPTPAICWLWSPLSPSGCLLGPASIPFCLQKPELLLLLTQESLQCPTRAQNPQKI